MEKICETRHNELKTDICTYPERRSRIRNHFNPIGKMEKFNENRRSAKRKCVGLLGCWLMTL